MTNGATPGPEPAPGRILPPSPCEIASWILSGAALILVLRLGLLPGLLSGLLVYELVHIIAPRLSKRLVGDHAKVLAVALLAAVVAGGLTFSVAAAIAFFHSGPETIPSLLRKMAEIVEGAKSWLPPSLYESFPDSAEGIRTGFAEWLRTHSREIGTLWKEVGGTAVHIVIGMVIGAIVSLRDASSRREYGPLAQALVERAELLGDAFRRVVFAQARISLVNTAATAVYLAVALPLSGVHLPFTKTLIAVTFFVGLLPVVGNLVSNTIIVIVSLGHSFPVGVASLVFLVVVHKMEYFLNARIVGSRIGAASWELLLAMFTMEAAFGIAGLVAAPIYYALLKEELRRRNLV